MTTRILFAVLALPTLTRWVPGDWPVAVCEVLILCALALVAIRRSYQWQPDLQALALVAMPLFGLVQLAVGITSFSNGTLLEALHWATLAAVFLLARQSSVDRREFLNYFEIFGTVLATLCILQRASTDSRVLWIWDAGHEELFATFPYRNNWAQFGELVLPVAAYRSLRPSRNWYWHALAAGIIFASVVASASRAGTVLAIVEVLAVGAIYLLSRDSWSVRSAGALAIVPALALVIATAAGIDKVAERFQSASVYEGRHEFLTSAIDMIRTRPLSGHGLGSFERVYPQFATIDFDGLIVNHAHNDYAELGAEGGIPFLIVGLVALLPVVLRIRTHAWLIGCAAFLLHALVDFPFARLATAGWFFALGGIASGCVGRSGHGLMASGWISSLPRSVFRWGTVVVAGAASLLAAGLALADGFYRMDTPGALKRAIAINPLNPAYYVRQAQLDPGHSAELLHLALARDPLDARVLNELAIESELTGDSAQAEKLLLSATRIDQTAGPRWALLNFYARHNRPTEFWNWLPKALSIMGGEAKAAFRLAEQVNPQDGRRRTAGILPNRPAILREFLDYGIETNRLSDAVHPAIELVAHGNRGREANFLVGLVSMLIRDHRTADAQAVWDALTVRGWIPRRPPATLSRDPLPGGFDWRIYFPEGVTSSLLGIASTPAANARLEINFSGNQQEACVPAEIFLPVHPGKSHRFRFRYQTENIPANSGLYWRLIDPETQRTLSESASLTSVNLADGALEFTPSSQLVQIQLFYRRANGTSRIRGSLRLEDTNLVAN